jgi:ceramide glucosyltransferase
MIATIFLILLLAACTVSCSFWLVALGSLASVLKRRRSHGPAYEPRVSILKPVKGIDAGALENFASFCTQEYPRFEVLFGVADRKDPAVALIEQLQLRFPDLSIRLFVAEPLGTNPKAATLHCLAAEAKGEILAICDADIRVGPDFLRRVVAPLADPQIGLVTCLYRGEMPQNLSARLEALHMDAAFAPSVALAWKHGTKVGLGAAVIMRRNDLERAGGYAGIADHLLDDYEIAARIAGLGLRIHLSDCPVASVLGSMHFPQQWAREVRWQRGIRLVRPLQYPGMIITFSLPLALAAAAFLPLTHWALVAVPGVLAVRWFVAWRAAVLLGQRERRYLAWLPVRDLLSLAVWIVAMFGRRVKWRGQEFVLRRDGRLRAMETEGLPDGLLARGIRRLDAHLRRKQGIFEFSDSARSVLRINIAPAETDLTFADGTEVRPGEPVGVLHLWNEHLTTIPRGGADLAWAMAMRKAMQFSLRELAKAARHDPRLRDVKAFGGTAVFVSRAGVPQVAKMASRFGFEWMPDGRKRSMFGRVHDFFENFLVLGLQWAFNPAGMRGKGFIRPREPLWMSRETLMKRYQPAPKKKPVPRDEVISIASSP